MLLRAALRARQLLAQPRVQVAAVVETGEEVGKAAARQARAVDAVLDADGGHQPQVREEVARQLAGEADRVGAREHQHPVELLAAPQRDERQAPGRGQPRHQQLMVRLAVGPEPGAVEVRQLRGHGDQRIDEAHPGRLGRRGGITREQVADLVLRVVQDERHLVEPVREAQPVDQALEQLGERAGAQQLQLALLRLAQQRVVAAYLLGELGEARLQVAHLVLECVRVRGSLAVLRLCLRSAHRPVPQARRCVTVRRSSR